MTGFSESCTEPWTPKSRSHKHCRRSQRKKARMLLLAKFLRHPARKLRVSGGAFAFLIPSLLLGPPRQTVRANRSVQTLNSATRPELLTSKFYANTSSPHALSAPLSSLQTLHSPDSPPFRSILHFTFHSFFHSWMATPPSRRPIPVTVDT